MRRGTPPEERLGRQMPWFQATRTRKAVGISFFDASRPFGRLPSPVFNLNVRSCTRFSSSGPDAPGTYDVVGSASADVERASSHRREFRLSPCVPAFPLVLGSHNLWPER